MVSLPVVKRTCGECTVCCTVLAVTELNKGPYEKCAHEGAGCCAIYDQRPNSCRQLECLYLTDFLEGDERRRPDRLGIMFRHSDEQDVFANRYYGQSFLVCNEAWAGAAGAPEAKYFLEKLSKKHTILVKRLTEQALVLGPGATHFARAFERFMADQGAAPNAI